MTKKDYKKTRERCQRLCKEEREKIDNIVRNKTKIYQKNEILLSIEKNIIK